VSLKNHQRVHSSNKPYACSLCPKRFKSTDAKKKHEITHTGVRFACKLCEKSYSYKTQLAAHYRKDHDGATPMDTKDEQIDKCLESIYGCIPPNNLMHADCVRSASKLVLGEKYMS
uniref:C2H2-type domain-containing protein n=1 Tax=Anopheles atroparvus TaxID=41427 RepID=A0A182JF47_ANOAO